MVNEERNGLRSKDRDTEAAHGENHQLSIVNSPDRGHSARLFEEVR
jgi:hypothetical protein